MLPDSTREANQSDSKSNQCPDDTEQLENEKKEDNPVGTGKAPELSIKCAVPGCEVLSQQGFKLRHRICTKHQNMDSVMVDGIRQRFCQQCTKLHPLQMFEGQRRGCKKRLDRHNERRRLRKKLTHALEQHSKLNPSDRVYTQKDVIDLAMRLKDEVDDGSFSTKYSGMQSSQQNLSSEAKSEEERGSGGHSISANASNMVNQRSSGGLTPSASMGSALLKHDRAGDTWDGSLILPGSKRHVDAPIRSDAKRFAGSQSCQGMHSQQGFYPAGNSDLLPFMRGGAAMPRMDSAISDPGPGRGKPRDLPADANFSWFGRFAQPACAREEEGLHSGDGAWQFYSGAAGGCSACGGAGCPECMDGMALAGCADHPLQGSWAQRAGLEARALPPPVTLSSSELDARVYNLSMKIMGATPASLPLNLREEILSWLQCSPASIVGFIRPGCVHLSVDVLLSVRDHATALQSVPKAFAESASVASRRLPWCCMRTVLSLPDQVITADGGLVSAVPRASPEPRLSACTLDRRRRTVLLQAESIPWTGWHNLKITCRTCADGKWVDLQPRSFSREPLSVVVQLPAAASSGLSWIEVLQGSGSEETPVGRPITIPPLARPALGPHRRRGVPPTCVKLASKQQPPVIRCSC